MGYDGDNLRISKTTPSGATFYYYDGDQAMCEVNGAAGALTAVDTFGATGLISRNVNGSSGFYTFDPSGNVSERLDKKANILLSDMYDGFGVRQTTDTTHGPYAFSGQ